TEFMAASRTAERVDRIKLRCQRLVIASPYQSPRRAKPGRIAAMDEIAIRVARPGDARGIAKLDVETWRTAYAGVLSTSYLVGLSARRRELGWRGVILHEPRDVRIAVKPSDAIVGFGSCGPNRGDR